MTGNVNWTTEVDRYEGDLHSVNNSIFYNDFNLIQKIDQSTGFLNWKKKLGNYSQTRPVYFKDQVYFIGQDALQACEFSGACLTTITLNPYFDDDGQRRSFSKLDIDPNNGILLLSDRSRIFGYELPK